MCCLHAFTSFSSSRHPTSFCEMLDSLNATTLFSSAPTRPGLIDRLVVVALHQMVLLLHLRCISITRCASLSSRGGCCAVSFRLRVIVNKVSQNLVIFFTAQLIPQFSPYLSSLPSHKTPTAPPNPSRQNDQSPLTTYEHKDIASNIKYGE